jgi:hypothetical protein
MSLEALMMRSLRSWCSSSSARKSSNMDIIGDELVVGASCSAISACGLLTPIGVTFVIFVEMERSFAGSCCVLLLDGELTSELPLWEVAESFVLRDTTHQLLYNIAPCSHTCTTLACYCAPLAIAPRTFIQFQLHECQRAVLARQFARDPREELREAVVLKYTTASATILNAEWRASGHQT